MPTVHIRITNEGATPAQKAELIGGVTDLLQRILGKTPATTVVTIEEVDLANWGLGGLPVLDYRVAQVARSAARAPRS